MQAELAEQQRLALGELHRRARSGRRAARLGLERALRARSSRAPWRARVCSSGARAAGPPLDGEESRPRSQRGRPDPAASPEYERQRSEGTSHVRMRMTASATVARHATITRRRTASKERVTRIEKQHAAKWRQTRLSRRARSPPASRSASAGDAQKHCPWSRRGWLARQRVAHR